MKIDCAAGSFAAAADLDSTVVRLAHPFPDDLRAWVRASALVRAAQGIAQSNSLETLRPVFSFRATRFHHPWRMLAMHTYACGIGLWDVRLIADNAALDPTFRKLCAGEAPSMDLLRRFRNHNRGAVLRCVEELLRHAWCHRHHQRATATYRFLTMEILCEARARLHRAEQCDRADELCRAWN